MSEPACEIIHVAFDRPRATERLEPVRPAEGDPRRMAAVRGYLRARRLRENLLPRELFGEPAWDMLLDLYVSRGDARAVSTSDACIASAAPPTTALRWLNRLVESGLVVRVDDTHDLRRTIVGLSPTGLEAVRRWVDATLGQNGMPLLA